MSFDHTIKKATTSKIIEVMIRDSSTGEGKTSVAHGDVTASYVREAGNRTAITLASGSAGDSYSSGKWAEVDGSNTPGLYQLHLPDAALATGANAVTLFLKASAVLDKVIRISLIDADLRNSTSLGLTNLSTAVSTPPTASAIADAVLDEALSGHTGSGSLGKAIGDGVTAWVTATGFNTTTPPTVSAIADAVLDEALSGHTGSGSLGKAIGDGVTAWVTATGFNTVAPDNSSITAIKSKTDQLVFTVANQVDANALTGGGSGLDAAGVRSAVGLSSANLDTQLADIPSAASVADAVWDEAQSGHTTANTFGYFLDAQVSAAGSGGTGLYQVTVRVEDSSNNALQGARVNVDGTTLTLTTGSSGEIVFNLDSGVYLLNVSPPAGYTTPLGQVVTVATADLSETFTLVGSGTCSSGWLG